MNISLFQDAHLRRIGIHSQPEEINLLVANALRFIIQNVFAKFSNDFVVTISTAPGPIELWFQDIMSKLFATWGFMAVQLVKQDHKIKRIEVPGKRYCNMIMIDSFKSLERTYIADYNKNFDNMEYYFIFLQTKDEFIPHEMDMILRYCFDNYWIHCNVMIQNAKGQILIYTYFPFQENRCFQTKPELINEFKDKRFINDIMFPDKLINLHKCPLKVTTWEVPPFVINKTNPHFPSRKYSGFEITIMVAISREMNFTLNIDMISIDSYNKHISPANVPLNMLKNRETNITLGYFRRTAERDRIATPSYVTYYLPLAAIILRREAQFDNIEIFAYPFDKMSWLLILIVYGVVMAMNTLNAKDRRVDNFNIFEVLFGISLQKTPKTNSKRISFLTLIISSLILRTVYQSLLFHLFRTNFYKAPPSSMETLIKHNYKGLTSAMSKDFINNVPQIKDKSLYLEYTLSSNELYPFYIMENYNEEKYAVISVPDFALYYEVNILSFDKVLQILPINVNDQQIGLYFVKHSYLVERFNQYIISFQQAGLLEKWKDWSHMRMANNKHSSTIYEHSLMVNLNQLIGIFLMMIFMHLTAILCLCLEVLSKRKIKCLKKIFKSK